MSPHVPPLSVTVPAQQHPLEALYRARDATAEAAAGAPQIGMLGADRASYEHALAGLLQSLAELGALYALTFPASAYAPAGAGREDALLDVVRSLPEQITTATPSRRAAQDGTSGT